MKYLSWKEEKIDTSTGDAAAIEKIVSTMYADGFVFTRLGKGVMQQTRSARIDLAKFELSSENRRILKKVSDIVLHDTILPLSLDKNASANNYANDYDWSIAKCAKDFYDTKFGPNIMSAAKVKEMLTDTSKSNFNTLISFTSSGEKIGFAICYVNSKLLHYCYPFYNLSLAPKDMGLGMMIQAIIHAQKLNLRYVYLGSLQRPTDTYKLQFKGLEWFDGEKWRDDFDEVKKIFQQNEK